MCNILKIDEEKVDKNYVPYTTESLTPQDMLDREYE